MKTMCTFRHQYDQHRHPHRHRHLISKPLRNHPSPLVHHGHHGHHARWALRKLIRGSSVSSRPTRKQPSEMKRHREALCPNPRSEIGTEIEIEIETGEAWTAPLGQILLGRLVHVPPFSDRLFGSAPNKSTMKMSRRNIPWRKMPTACSSYTDSDIVPYRRSTPPSSLPGSSL